MMVAVLNTSINPRLPQLREFGFRYPIRMDPWSGLVKSPRDELCVLVNMHFARPSAEWGRHASP
jgi:hypothetical protein